MTDDLTEKAAALVDSMESALGVPHERPVTRKVESWGGQIIKSVQSHTEPCPPPDLDEKIEATKRALQ